MTDLHAPGITPSLRADAEAHGYIPVLLATQQDAMEPARLWALPGVMIITTNGSDIGEDERDFEPSLWEDFGLTLAQAHELARLARK